MLRPTIRNTRIRRNNNLSTATNKPPRMAKDRKEGITTRIKVGMERTKAIMVVNKPAPQSFRHHRMPIAPVIKFTGRHLDLLPVRKG